ncbi:sensor histidine kinase [Pedobacter sp.]
MKIYNKNWRHVLGVVCAIAYEQSSIFMFYGRIIVPDLLYYLVQIPFFYFSASLMFKINDREIERRRLVGVGLLAIVLFFALHAVIASTIQMLKTGVFQLSVTPFFFKQASSRYIYLVVLSFAYFQARIGIRKAKLASEKELVISERQRNQVELENAFLRSQINPHLLFNSLQFIEYQVELNSPKALRALQLLAELMHYSLKATSESNTVPLRDEITYIQRYIELATLRSDNQQHLQLNINAEAAASNLQLPSGILGNLIENMFKHGDLSRGDECGMVIIEIQDQKLLVQIHNLKRPESIYRKTGIGLQNLRKRLDLLYPGRYFFRSTEERNHYNLYLEMIL